MDVADLPATGTCELSTIARRSGQRRRVEIWYVVVDGQIVLTGTPGSRDWLANLRVHPEAVLHLRDPACDLAVTAKEVSDAGAAPPQLKIVSCEVARHAGVSRPFAAKDLEAAAAAAPDARRCTRLMIRSNRSSRSSDFRTPPPTTTTSMSSLPSSPDKQCSTPTWASAKRAMSAAIASATGAASHGAGTR